MKAYNKNRILYTGKEECSQCIHMVLWHLPFDQIQHKCMKMQMVVGPDCWCNHFELNNHWIEVIE